MSQALESLFLDLRFSFRSLRRQPWFVAVSVLSLALGIGVNVSIVSFINALFLRPLPAVHESGRLASVYYRNSAGSFSSCSYPDFEYYRSRSRTFSGMLAYLRIPVMMRPGEQAERVFGELVTENYFEVLDLNPTIGRLFAGEENSPVAVLSRECWERRFGADPNVIGRSLRIGNGLFTVIGVAPRGFRGIVVDWAEPPSLWVPLAAYREAVPPLAGFDILHEWGFQSYQVVGRLRPGVEVDRASEEMGALSRRIDQDHPERKKQGRDETRDDYSAVTYRTTQTRFWPGARGNVTNFLGLLTAVSVLMFLAACFNVANLSLARTAARRSEIAVRLSLGAARRRVIAQLLTESLLVSVAGGLAGLLVASGTSSFLARFHQAFRLPLSVEVGFDVRVLSFAVGISIVAGLLVALWPARLALRRDVSSALKSDTGTAGAHRIHTNQVLVGVQVALSVVLLIGAGLFVRTLRNAQAADVTLQSENVLLGELDLFSRGYDETTGGPLYERLLERIRSIPGVRDAALVFVVPLGGRRGGTNIMLSPDQGGGPKRVQVGFNAITPGYFRTIGIPIVRGRDIADSDRAGTAAVAMVNEEMVRRYFGNQDPLGRQFILSWPPAGLVQIVGIVRDGKFRNYRSPLEPTVYVPLAQRYQMTMNLEVRASGNPAGLVAAVRGEIAALDKDLPLTGVKTLKTHLNDALAQERLTASLLSALGALALLLCAVGIYGILSYSVAQRTREIGVRMALGAGSRQLLWTMISGAMRPVIIGLSIGTAAALTATRLIRGLLYGLSPADPLVFSTTVVLLVVVGILAAYLPARRASRVNPIKALRHE